MKYLLMITSDPDRPWTGSEEDKAGMADLLAVRDELVATGEHIDSRGLAEVAEGLLVSVRDGAPVVSDGPFAEAKEQLAGYFLVECSRDRVVEIAAQISAGQGAPIAVRPVVDDETLRAACD